MLSLLRPQFSSWIYVGGLLCTRRVINTRWGSGHSHWCLVMVVVLIKAQIGLGLWELGRRGEPSQDPATGMIAQGLLVNMWWGATVSPSVEVYVGIWFLTRAALLVLPGEGTLCASLWEETGNGHERVPVSRGVSELWAFSCFGANS